MSQGLADCLKRYGLLLTILGLLLSGILSAFGLDNLASAYAFLGTALIFGLAAWKVWVIPAMDKKRRVCLKCVVLLLIVACGVGWGYFLWWASQPRFEVTAFETLESDKNAYELTDMLIWNQDRLEEYNVSITFTLEIRPVYYGKQEFGKVVALVSGDGDHSPLETPLWDNFDSESSTQQIQLTLSEILYASGLQKNSDPPSNPLCPGDLPFQQANLVVQIARAAAKTNPWDSEKIIIRNAPWESRSEMVLRNGRREVDVYLRNLGGTGDFTFLYQLVRLEKEINSSPSPMGSGTTYVTHWHEPTDLIRLNTGDFFTDTVSVPGDLTPGRYLLEVYPIKKQEHVKFKSGATWEDLNMESPWWFARSPFRRHLFVETTITVAPTIQREWERLRDEQDVDLGLAIELSDEVTSPTGSVGQRQVFQKGEIYVHDGQAYALYGPILEHYEKLGGVEYYKLGFPISSIHAVTSSLGTDGAMMQFEGPGDPHPPTVIYASRKGVAAIWEWIGWVHSDNSWLGFPVADAQHLTDDSRVQPFECGYIFYHYPYVNGERDWREPVAYPYPAGRGTLFDVHAQQRWQDTGVQVQPGDRVTVVQVDGTWTHWGPGEELYDANGYANLGVQDDTTLPSAITGALIGRIGEEDGHVFSVGRWSVLTAPAEGTLYLAMNDNNYEDNAGFITVQIVVERSD
jgi:hypothetical protein